MLYFSTTRRSILLYEIVKEIITELDLGDCCETKLKLIVDRRVKERRKNNMFEPNEAWEKTPNMTFSDSQTRRTVSMSNEIFNFAVDRYPKLRYNSLSEYIRWLILYDERYGLLDAKNIAKLELELSANPKGKPSFWQKKRFSGA
jgi:hypothetical protein